MNADPFSPPQTIVAEQSYVEGMRLEYELKFGDLYAFNILHQFLSPVIHGMVLLLTLFIFANEAEENSLPMAALTALTWYCGIWIFQILFILVASISPKNKTQLTHHAVEVSDRSFFEETKFNQTHAFWPGVFKAVSRPGFVAVYIAQHQAHVIPNRAFASQQQRSQFLALVREKIERFSGT